MDIEKKRYAAFYSVIQYMPDQGRREGVNVGITLLREEPYFFNTRMNSDNSRAKRFFPGVNVFHLDMAKAAFYNSLERFNKEFGPLTRASLQMELDRRSANTLVAVELRACALDEDAFPEYEGMFKELVL